MKFINTHCHSEYSMLDGMSRIDEIIEYAKGSNGEFVCVNDHANMNGVPRLAYRSKEEKLKPIAGCEYYLMDENANRGSVHINVMAINKIGYKNMCNMTSLQYNYVYYKPRITKQMLEEHKDGIIVTDACVGGTYHHYILEGKDELAYNEFMWFLNTFGDHFCVEYHDHGISDEEKCNKVKLEWANKHGVPILASIDSHYAKKSDEEIHKVLLAMQMQKQYGDYSFEGSGYHMMNPLELMMTFPQEYIDNTYDVISRLYEEEPIEFNNKSLFPIWS